MEQKGTNSASSVHVDLALNDFQNSARCVPPGAPRPLHGVTSPLATHPPASPNVVNTAAFRCHSVTASLPSRWSVPSHNGLRWYRRRPKLLDWQNRGWRGGGTYGGRLLLLPMSGAPCPSLICHRRRQDTDLFLSKLLATTSRDCTISTSNFSSFEKNNRDSIKVVVIPRGMSSADLVSRNYLMAFDVDSDTPRESKGLN